MEPGPSDAMATVKLVDQRQADVGYPSPGEFSLGLEHSKLPANSFVIRKAGRADLMKKKIYARYFQGWAAGLEFGKQNPRTAADRHGAVPGPGDADGR